jgi:hypothetical protein
LHVSSAREGVQSIHLRLDLLFGNLATPARRYGSQCTQGSSGVE